MTPSITIGLAGGTGAGKTTLAHMLAGALGEVIVLDLDSYYLDRSGLSPEMRGRLNFDEPDAFDVTLLVRHLRHLQIGRPVEKPRYSFEHHTRTGVDTLYPAPIVVVEGLFALWWKELRETLNLKVYLDAPPDIRLERRIARDIESRGRTVQSVRHQYETTVRPMHERYVAPTRAHADLILCNDRAAIDCLRAVRSALDAVRAHGQVLPQIAARTDHP